MTLMSFEAHPRYFLSHDGLSYDQQCAERVDSTNGYITPMRLTAPATLVLESACVTTAVGYSRTARTGYDLTKIKLQQ